MAAGAAIGGAIGQVAGPILSLPWLASAEVLGANKTPEIPAFRKIDAAQTQLDTIEGNLAALPRAGELAAQANKLSQDQLDDALRQAIPDIDKIKTRASGNIASLLAGEVPDDVQSQIQNNAAAKALGGGFAGGGMHRNLVARDIGLTSLDLMNRGQSSADRWLRTSRATTMAPQMSVTSMFFTPSQRLAHETGERDREFSRNLLKSEIDALPTGMASVFQAMGTAQLGSGASTGGALGSLIGGGGGGGFAGGGGTPNFQASGSSFFPTQGGVPG